MKVHKWRDIRGKNPHMTPEKVAKLEREIAAEKPKKKPAKKGK